MIGREQDRANALTATTEALPMQRAAYPGTMRRTARAALIAHWPRVGLTAVLALSALLNLVWLDREGYANTYYAAAVKSMLTSWRAFFFASFDGGGFVTVDKPPLGLWIQTASAKLFGFSGLSLLLPQALAGVAAVGLLYWLIRRAWGPAAGLIAALALAVTPISVVTNRNNTHDSLLILALLGGAWAVSVATERGRLRLLLLGALLVGLAFNIKMLQAYLVLPAFLLVYLLGAPRPWRTRLGHLALAVIVMLAVSLAWVVAVDRIPANQRPYVGSSGNNSALSLVLGYNGLTRLTLALPESLRNVLSFLPGDVDLTSAPGMSPGVGDPGLLRLFNDGLGGQASWLLALAGIGLVAGVLTLRPRLPLDQRGQSLVLWGGWLLGAGGYFTVARFFHLYYLIMLGPAIAALSGIGIVALWRLWRRGGWRRALLPLALTIAAYAQYHLLQPYQAWRDRLAMPIVVVCLVAAGTLVSVHLRPRLARLVAPTATSVALLALLATPLVWSVVSVQGGNGGAWLPQAGPASAAGFGGDGNRNTPPQSVVQGRAAQPGRGNTAFAPGNRGGTSPGNAAGIAPQGGRGGGQGALTIAGAEWDMLNPDLVQYLRANQGEARYLVATTTSTYASVFMLATDQPALALGGYQGWDRILTPETLAALVATGEVRFFYLGASTNSGLTGGTNGQDTTVNLAAWVRTNCATVPATQWQGTTITSGPSQGQGATQNLQLYDCASALAGQP